MKAQVRSLGTTLALLVALPLPVICSAEIYGWIDSNGVVTYSNLPPPGGVDVTQVIHEEPVSAKAASDAAKAAKDAEAAALNDRLRLREWELSRSQSAPADYYPAGPMPASAPPDWGCGAYGYDNCEDLYLWWPYGYRSRYWNRWRGEHGFPSPTGRGRPPVPTHAAVHSGTGAHSR